MVKRTFDAIARGDMSTIDELFAEDYVEHDPIQGEVDGREAFENLIRMYEAAFTDIQFEVTHVLTDGEYAAWMVKFSGTNTGPFMGMPPTGKRVETTGVNMGRINAEGKAVEHWAGNDILQLLQQLGMIPQMSAEGA